MAARRSLVRASAPQVRRGVYFSWHTVRRWAETSSQSILNRDRLTRHVSRILPTENSDFSWEKYNYIQNLCFVHCECKAFKFVKNHKFEVFKPKLTLEDEASVSVESWQSAWIRCMSAFSERYCELWNSLDNMLHIIGRSAERAAVFTWKIMIFFSDSQQRWTCSYSSVQ